MEKWRDQTTPAIVCGRKFCSHPDHEGRRWLHVVYFGVQKWRPQHMMPKLQNYCQTCSRRVNKEYHLKNRKEVSARVYKQRHYVPRVPVGPFQAWLRYQVQVNSIGGVARNIGVSPRRITSLIAGHYTKKGVTYQVKMIKLSTVDAWMTSFGESYTTIYKEIPSARQAKQSLKAAANDKGAKKKKSRKA